MAVLDQTISEPITIEEAAETGYEFTFEEYLRTPIPRNRYAIEDGKVIMSSRPTTEHQWFTLELCVRLRDFVLPNKLGVVLMAPVDVIIAREPKLKTRQPDVLYFSRERAGVRGRKDLKKMPTD